MPLRPVKNSPRPAMGLGNQSFARKARSSPRLQGLCRAVLRRDPVCCDPLSLHIGRVVSSTEAHHIKGIAKHPELAFDMKNMKGVCGECHDAVEVLVLRGIDTTDLFSPIPNPSLSLKACSPRGNSIYCARMKLFRSTKCAGCSL